MRRLRSLSDQINRHTTHLMQQAGLQSGDKVREVRLAQRRPDRLVAVLTEGVQVVPEAAGEQHRVLQQDGGDVIDGDKYRRLDQERPNILLFVVMTDLHERYCKLVRTSFVPTLLLKKIK